MHHLSFLADRGNLISVTTAGQGPPLILLHGFPLDHRQWLPQLKSLSANYHVIAPDLRGFGRSALTDQPYTISDLASDVEQVRHHFANGERIALCGLSMGGYVAFEYWRSYAPQLAGLILANTKPDADSDQARLARAEMCTRAQAGGAWEAVSGMLPKLLSEQHLNEQGEAFMATQQMLKDCSVEAVCCAQRALANRADFIARLPSIHTPTLVITGEADSIAPADATRKWAAVIPDSRCHVIPQAAHLTPLESPEQFNQPLHDFLQDVC
jgi:3-oxoadipate enol-lactonase